MSKVYSFRLNDDNPREAQAREVIDAWVREGYALRQVVVETLLSYKIAEVGQDELNSVVEQLKVLILCLDKQPIIQTLEDSLPTSFLDSVKQTARSGLSPKGNQS